MSEDDIDGKLTTRQQSLCFIVILVINNVLFDITSIYGLFDLSPFIFQTRQRGELFWP